MDPLHDALKEATLAVLLGSTNVPVATTTPDGLVSSYGTITIGSAFQERLRSKAMQGEFDDLLHRAMEQVDVQSVARALEGLLAEELLRGLAKNTNVWGSNMQPSWLQSKSKDIAIEACTAALMADETMMETLREKIGMQVDRNRVGISVNLSDPES